METIAALPGAQALALLCISGGIALLTFALVGRRGSAEARERARVAGARDRAARSAARGRRAPGTPLPPLRARERPRNLALAIVVRVLGVGYLQRHGRAVAISLVGCGAIFLFFHVLIGWTILGVIGATVAVLVVPRQIAGGRREKDLLLLDAALADAFATLRDLIRAGNSITRSVTMLGRSGPPVLQPIFLDIDAQLASGIALEVALARIQEQLQNHSFDIASQAIVVAHTSGGTRVSEIMDNIATQMRSTLAIKREATSKQTEGVWAARILGALPVLMFMILRLGSPELMEVYDTVVGQIVLGVVMLMVLGGYLWMMKIVAPPVRPRLLRPHIEGRT